MEKWYLENGQMVNFSVQEWWLGKKKIKSIKTKNKISIIDQNLFSKELQMGLDTNFTIAHTRGLSKIIREMVQETWNTQMLTLIVEIGQKIKSMELVSALGLMELSIRVVLMRIWYMVMALILFPIKIFPNLISSSTNYLAFKRW